MKEGFWRQNKHKEWVSDWMLKADPKRRECVEFLLPWPEPAPTPASPAFVEALAAVEAVATRDEYMGCSECRLCSVSLGCHEFDLGGWVWPGGFSHYVKQHNVHPTLAFERFVMTASGSPE